MNKLFGRSIKEKGRDGKNIVEQLSARKFFLINNKGNIKYEKAFNMTIKDNYFVFTFHSFLIGRLYDSRKNFFDDINSLYEALFFEFLFDKTNIIFFQTFKCLTISFALIHKTVSVISVLMLKDTYLINNFPLLFPTSVKTQLHNIYIMALKKTFN